jgi:hypothetical protein
MPSRYHPIEDGLWDDPKFDAWGDLPEAPGDERGFFAFLSSNKFQRLAGIYRATDGELAEAYRWSVARVKRVIASLVLRRLVVRDGAWIFLPGYWKRQAHNPGMLIAARKSVMACSSSKILSAFVERYPLHREWLPNGWRTVGEPMNENAPAEQLPSRAVTEQLQRGVGGSDQAPALDPALAAILTDCPHLSLVNNGASAGFWDQVLGACEPYPLADSRWLGAKLRAWNVWFESRPSRRSRDRKRLESRLMGWLVKDLENLARKP